MHTRMFVFVRFFKQSLIYSVPLGIIYAMTVARSFTQ